MAMGLLLFLILLPSFAVWGQPSPADFVILISVDGLRPDFYQDRSWPAPFLQRMATEGAQAGRVRGVFPSLTYPSHTTIVTGALPIRHGVYYNSPFEPDGSSGLWYWSSDSVRVPTIWEAAGLNGLRTASIHWPVTTGAAIDFNVPEAWPLDYSVSRLEFLRGVSTPPGILEELEREATGRLVDYDANGRTERWRYRFLDAKATEMAAYLLSVYRPSLTTVHLLSVDDAAHEGSDTPEVRAAVAAVDALVSYLFDVVEALGIADRTALIVVGDHGFSDVNALLAPNAWLFEEGLTAADRANGDWKATFHTKGGAAFLHLRESTDKRTEDRVRSTLEALRPEVRSRFEMLDREELLAAGSDTSAALALAARPGTAFVDGTDSPAVRPGTGATHGHLPDSQGIYTGLVAFGAGIRVGGSPAEIQLTDVAPLVTYLLGLSLRAPDGELRDALIATPPRSK